MTFKFANKDKVRNLQEQISKKQISFIELPIDVLAELFQCAIERIDEDENTVECDERDSGDLIWDMECIVDELFDALQEKVDFGLYE